MIKKKYQFRINTILNDKIEKKNNKKSSKIEC
jgi:hypothetical protein